MREIRTSGLMSGEGKRSDWQKPQATAPFLDSTANPNPRSCGGPPAKVAPAGRQTAAGEPEGRIGAQYIEIVRVLVAAADRLMLTRLRPCAVSAVSASCESRRALFCVSHSRKMLASLTRLNTWHPLLTKLFLGWPHFFPKS